MGWSEIVGGDIISKRVVVVGSGVVGTATGCAFLELGHRVEFIDKDRSRVQSLLSRGLTATETLNLAGPPAVVLVSVPTPSNGHGYDLRILLAALADIAEALRTSTAHHVVAIRSTVPPGTCDTLIAGELEAGSGFTAGIEFGLAANPEFLRAETATEDARHPRVTVVGSRFRTSIDAVAELHEPLGGLLRTYDNPAEAEFIKCMSNLFNATKISFWNEAWLVAERLGLNSDALAETVAQTAEGSWNPAYGIKGGYPFGGECLPKDVRGFREFARVVGVATPIFDAVEEVNQWMSAVANEPPQLNENSNGPHPWEQSPVAQPSIFEES